MDIHLHVYLSSFKYGVIAFNRDVRAPENCFTDKLVSVTKVHQDTLKAFINGLNTGPHETDIEEAFTAAFKFFSSSPQTLNGEERGM